MPFCVAISRAASVFLLLAIGSAFASTAEVRNRVKTTSTAQVAEDAMRLLHNNCLSCHSAEKHKGGLQLTTREALLKGGDSGAAITPGKADKSLIVKVLAADADPHMPPKKQLSGGQIELMRRWVSAGAPWDTSALAKAAAPRAVTLAELPPSYHPVLAMALSPDDTRLAIARGSRISIHSADSTNFNAVAERSAHRDAVRSLAWSADGKFLASGSFRELTLWDAKLTPVRSVSSNLLDRINAVAFAGDKLIVSDGSAAQNGWVRIFSVESGSPVTNWQAHADAIYDLTVSADGKTLATAGSDGFVKLWDLASFKELSRIEAHVGAVFAVAFNSNATEIVTVGADKQLKVWDAATRESFVSINGKKHVFTSLAYSADGKTVIAGADDGRLFSYSEFKRHSGAQSSDTAKERELGDWPEPLYAVAISSDGKRSFAGDHDGNAFVANSDRKLLATISPPNEMPATTEPVPPSFVRDVLPALAKAGCMAGSCHAKAEGQNGFKLSVFSYDPASDFAEIVKEGRGRRVFPAAPEESLLLLKPTMTIDHGGGERFERGSETYNLLARWIRGGMIYQHTNEPALARITVEPRERTYRKRASQPLKVTAHYADGSTRDVTRLADYVSNDKELAQVNEDGVVRIGTLPGQSVVVARYMGFVDAARVAVPADRTLPAKRYAKLAAHNFIDEHAYAQFQKLGLFPSDLCTDTEFLRRSSLDAIGMLPTAEETRAFLANTNANKRTEWIEHLLAHPAYGDYWANKWADLLRPNPDRVGVKSVYVLDQWLRESFRANKPYDQFARELLTAEGSNHRYGPAVVYRDRREPPELTTIFSQLFLGTRMECAKCHHHPTEKWSQDDFYQFAAFFDPVKQKGAGLSPPISAGTETFYFGGGRSAVKHPVTEQVMSPRPPDGPVLTNDSKADPRGALADWLTNPDNPFFAKAAANRVWANFFGRGIVEPVDDFRSSNPASNQPLLDALAEDFAKHGYDLKHLIRTIMSSRIYQLSSIPNEFNLKDTKNFSRSYRRRLPAEVLLDAAVDVTGVPEDFEGCPPGTRALQTWSYKIDSHFMDAFGRPNPSSDCPCERDLRTSVVQSLHMMNSRSLQAKLAHAEGRVKKLAESKLTPSEIVTELYFTALNRPPTNNELNNAASVYEALDATRQTATEDVLWALLNSPEFVFNH